MSDPVQDTVDSVNRNLDASGMFNTVTHDEVRNSVEAIQALPADQADQVIDQLAQSGQLDRLAEEVMDGDWFGNGGLSSDERQRFFADMAGKLDGQSLSSLSNSFARKGGDDGGYEPVTELGRAVATHAAPQEKVEYIRQLGGETEVNGRLDTGFGYANTSYTDAEGRAIGDVLGSLRGTYAEQGFQALGGNLNNVLESSIDANLMTTAGMMGGGGSNSMNWSVDQFKGIMDAAASMGNADLKAQVFSAGAQTMREVANTDNVIGGLTVVGKDDTLRAMTDGLKTVIDSDTTGVMRELTYNASTMDGSDFSTYAKQMLEQGRNDELAAQMGRLQFGNGMNENAVTRLDETTTVPGTTQERRENAGALGYFVGATQAAAQSITTDVAEQRAIATAFLKSVLAVVDKASPLAGPAAPAVGTSASVAKEWVQFGVNAAISDPTADAGIMLERAALPVDNNTRELGVGDNVASAFEDRLASVGRTAKP